MTLKADEGVEAGSLPYNPGVIGVIRLAGDSFMKNVLICKIVKLMEFVP